MGLEQAVLNIVEMGFVTPRQVYKFVKFSHPRASKIKVYNLVYAIIEKNNKESE